MRQNYKTFATNIESEGRHLPKQVTKEFDEYLKCGILAATEFLMEKVLDGLPVRGDKTPTPLFDWIHATLDT